MKFMSFQCEKVCACRREVVVNVEVVRTHDDENEKGVGMVLGSIPRWQFHSSLAMLKLHHQLDYVEEGMVP